MGTIFSCPHRRALRRQHALQNRNEGNLLDDQEQRGLRPSPKYPAAPSRDAWNVWGIAANSSIATIASTASAASTVAYSNSESSSSSAALTKRKPLPLLQHIGPKYELGEEVHCHFMSGKAWTGVVKLKNLDKRFYILQSIEDHLQFAHAPFLEENQVSS